jgi:hypothetical protein
MEGGREEEGLFDEYNGEKCACLYYGMEVMGEDSVSW